MTKAVLLLALAGCGAPGPAAAGPRRAVVEAYRPALRMKGDRARGRELYEHSCAGCHRLAGRGHAVGPDLDAARARPPEELLEEILDPNRRLDPRYANVTIRTKDGEVFEGMMAAETASEVRLVRAQGETDAVPRGRIERLVRSGVSIMPEGYEEGIDLERMADLLAFLRDPGGD